MPKPNNLTEATKQYYEDLVGQLGEEYFHHRWGDHPVKRSHYQHTRRAIETIFNANIGQVNDLLEVGCGSGIWTDIMLQHAKRVTLFDISHEMLKVAKNKYRDNPCIKDYIQGDYIEGAQYLGHEYDAIFSSRAIEYMSDKRRMVAQSYDRLKPGGTLIIVTKNPEWQDKKREQGKSSSEIQTDWVSWRDLSRLYREAGFSQIGVYPVALGSYYPPFNSKVGILTCDILSILLRGREMRRLYNYLSESYLIYGKKQAEAAIDN